MQQLQQFVKEGNGGVKCLAIDRLAIFRFYNFEILCTEVIPEELI